MASRANLSDIAKALGVSVATVSNAMSGKGRVSKELGRAIREKAKELGYVPSLAGRALSTGRSHVLGLVLADIGHPLFPQFAQAIEHAASEAGYGVLIGDSRGDIEAQSRAINRLIERGADGIVVVPRHGTCIADIGRPVAVIDSPSTPGNTVAADHRNGGLEMGRHLLELGHRSVAIIGLHSDSNVQNDRIAGIREAFAGKGEARLIWIGEMERSHGSGCPLGLVGLVEEGVTAFAAVSDLHALRAITELQQGGVSIPDDVSVTGFDDLIWAGVIAPSLTTMRMDMERIAEIAIADLISQIDQGGARDASSDLPALKGQSSIPMELIIRQSSGPVSGRAAPGDRTPVHRWPASSSATDPV
ncbi:LacI family DNA-binding transcriptional regulator [Nitratireductor aquimarinus]|uniref:LacI family DNA-binding transcriptional regulator n=1 Tax=Nitratireductor aquimarinus TaxID=889300 RepID=A0ABU4AH68_9HYPH|nr:LacI family DNA-binding transcriptional regulator [Nitratireductor aquimarinus]MDV6225595.1 LacI family DNA-binding transcriptional regulator [Nitratireductor aquimarinus]